MTFKDLILMILLIIGVIAFIVITSLAMAVSG